MPREGRTLVPYVVLAEWPDGETGELIVNALSEAEARLTGWAMLTESRPGGDVVAVLEPV